MTSAHQQNIGGIATMVDALRAKSQVAAAAFGLKGVAVDLEKWGSALLLVSVGAAEGTPDTFAVDAKLQHSDTTTDGDFADVVASPLVPTVAITQVTVADTRRFIEIARPSALKRYVRLVFTVAFTGGSSPKIGLQSTACLSGTPITPVVHA